MEVTTFTILYHKKVVQEDIPRLSAKDRNRISDLIERKLTSNPESFGKVLRRSLKGHRSLRTDPYRVIFRIDRKTVKILAIQHRSVVYREAGKRKKFM